MKTAEILILGAGYGGIMTTLHLQKLLSIQEGRITLVNKHRYHYQTTLLHENAAGTAHQDNNRVNIDEVIDTKRVNFVQDEVCEIQTAEKRVLLKSGKTLLYDYLVVALGFEPATFGIPGLKEHSFSIRSINEARKIREHIQCTFARYHHEKRDEMLALVVGGAGFTGIEFVGELVERVPVLCKEYDIDPSKVRIINIEAGQTILPGFAPELVNYAYNYLKNRGVEFYLGRMIKTCTPDGVIIAQGDDEEEIKADTVVWTGGVQGNSLVGQCGFPTARGRVEVRKDLRAPHDDHIFVIGDCAVLYDEQTGRPYPPSAQITIQQAEGCAENIKALLKGQPLKEIKPEFKGTVASLGSEEAIGIVFGKIIVGTKAVIMKKIIDNRYLYMLGGFNLLLKKGKFKLF
ncbi:NAD(P)/FAD-dependent oxidoreductase [Heliorestis acidaminivorans]|uniref:NAD(P)/FAD-dependent oxidoreductase n=1 Tax=Heliorestis acidaminivorans TaxID=553427 RepID=A0A6I0EXH0_9FIRM|nr:NAD(P)/FAD-dependent oxidoreductase [Heliorestis acidaminivorans]KAB2951184.1 NAD(P)/FAD-dependent oxidoreductase [Heliorestis acidaminivorans]